MAPNDPQTAAATSVDAPKRPAAPAGQLVLPLSVVSRSDVSRALRELLVMNDYFHQASIRGGKDQQLPTVSRVLDSLANENNLNLLQPDDRARLVEFLTRLKSTAPVVHISFASEASGPFLAKVLEWFRREAHPHTVLHVGLQPELAAGCSVRTTNKSFDFSFRRRFEQSKKKLIAALEVVSKEVEAEVIKSVAQSTAAPAEAPVPEQPGGAA